MTTKAQITRRASEDGVSARTVERDYALAHVVAAIGLQGGPPSLVLKGGTALRLCLFPDYRYSADLDFSIVAGTLAVTMDIISAALASVAGSITGARLTDEVPRRIAFTGPLGRERTIKLDLAGDEVVTSVERRPLIRRWPDLPLVAETSMYTPDEIAGEKLRCVLQRMQCRDAYDLFNLFERAGIDQAAAAGIFERKASHRGLDPSSFASVYRDRIDQYRKRWVLELREHVPGAVPGFDEIERGLARHLRSAGLL